mgnify:FL=1
MTDQPINQSIPALMISWCFSGADLIFSLVSCKGG